MIPQYQLFSKTIFLLKRETSFAYLFRPNFYVVWRVEGFAEGVGVGGVVGVFVVVDELSYPLHGVVEHGPSLVWMVC